MKAIVKDWHTEIFPTDKEISDICKPGTEDACIWLTIGPLGWECVCLNKPHSLSSRFEKGETNAKRDGCDKVKKLDVLGKPGEWEF